MKGSHGGWSRNDPPQNRFAHVHGHFSTASPCNREMQKDRQDASFLVLLRVRLLR
jgi:hypothetical protein